MLKTVIARKTDNIVTNIVNVTTTMIGDGLLVNDASGEYIISRITENYDIYENMDVIDQVAPVGKTLSRTLVDPIDKVLIYEYIDIPISATDRITELESQNAQMLMALVAGGLM